MFRYRYLKGSYTELQSRNPKVKPRTSLKWRFCSKIHSISLCCATPKMSQKQQQVLNSLTCWCAVKKPLTYPAPHPCNDAISNCVQLYLGLCTLAEPRSCWPIRELTAALSAQDPLYDGEMACCAFLKNFSQLSGYGLNFWPFGPREW